MTLLFFGLTPDESAYVCVQIVLMVTTIKHTITIPHCERHERTENT